MSEQTWKQIWDRKGREAAQKSELGLADLLAADGFDGPLGKTTERSRDHLGRRIAQWMNAGPGRRILEVGCGAGAALMLLRESGASLSGVDSSQPHIEIARRVLPECEFHVAEANGLPYAGRTFDGVFSHGVFLYFPGFDYAAHALGEMHRVAVPGARLLITDVPDAARREECEAARRAAGASLTPPHLYYPRDFFLEFGHRQSLLCEFFAQDIPDYANSPFRYNVLFSSPGAGVN